MLQCAAHKYIYSSNLRAILRCFVLDLITLVTSYFADAATVENK